jgi:hypothetical protein
VTFTGARRIAKASELTSAVVTVVGLPRANHSREAAMVQRLVVQAIELTMSPQIDGTITAFQAELTAAGFDDKEVHTAFPEDLHLSLWDPLQSNCAYKILVIRFYLLTTSGGSIQNFHKRKSTSHKRKVN